ncbi:hypothetical protein PVA44_04595 [Entomospira nematocerorum]|uniref:Lipoprotein n=1 Tax=Entomospira nematocerorum TaxID=2719987 RepID=A0A968GBA5_9SPIO|nr:hypothetical protein [Entomospira nematocera]NIZ46700.1 hypothetical protein [Entomospira nematocera]WDI33504.1 hypothetical protein PVA44_04595 [Entomospira nematocera]
MWKSLSPLATLLFISSCNPIIDKTTVNSLSKGLPLSESAGSLYFILDDKEDPIGTHPYTMGSSQKAERVLLESPDIIAKTLDESGTYFYPVDTKKALTLTYDKAAGDQIEIDYVTGEAWTLDKRGKKSSTSQGFVQRQANKSFDHWSINDPEIIALNQKRIALGKKPLTVGDKVTVKFYFMTNGSLASTYVLSFYNKPCYTIKK